MADRLASESFDDFVVARGPALLRLAYMICGDYQRSEDLVQTVLARLYRRWPSLKIDNKESYARRAVVNENLSFRRRLS